MLNKTLCRISLQKIWQKSIYNQGGRKPVQQGECWRCRKAKLCCSWKLKTPSQHLPLRHDRTDQEGQQETGTQTYSAGWDTTPWVPISVWWRKGTCAQVCRLQTRPVWSLERFFSKTKPFGAPYTSRFLSLQGAPASQFEALLSNQDA